MAKTRSDIEKKGKSAPKQQEPPAGSSSSTGNQASAPNPLGDVYSQRTETWDCAAWMSLDIWKVQPMFVKSFIAMNGIPWDKEWNTLSSANLQWVTWGCLYRQGRTADTHKPTTIPSPDLSAIRQDPNIPTLIAAFQALQAKVDDNITQQQELRRSLEFTQGRQDELINQLRQSKRQPAHMHTESPSCAVVVTGLSPGEAETAADAVKTLITDTLRLPENITQAIQEVLPVTATREVKEGEQPRPSKIIIRFATPSTINTILRVASRLKEENCRRKAAGEFTIGIDRELTGEDRKRRNALWPQFRDAKAAGKAAFWRGPRLFIDGDEVSPPQ